MSDTNRVGEIYQLDSRVDREGASLVFESESVVRRLRVFPVE